MYPGLDYDTATATCNFCGNPMPCWCKEPDDFEDSWVEDQRARDRLLIIDNTEQILDLNQEHKVVQKFLQNNR